MDVDWAYPPHDTSATSDIPHQQRRAWNQGPLTDFFPRIPPTALENLLDICLAKNAIYDLSKSKHYNARRFTSIAVAHIRHKYTKYDALLRDNGLGRYEAREQTAGQVWKVLRQWCPWDESNDQLERCLKASVVRPEDRGRDFDPMDVDEESEDEREEDPMEVD